ncbi:hypothetical protein BDB00DRAFT_815946 [Zychaea mexicana]|uniref:uncharacterized protein n=1 Tax=Zychaea mexicana TaxID=64656 RepID=UPI0022FE4C09|nr:uncharacterized protein BDB00DRAFT_815946 [Zychaea mexicana]KAI9495110.1 hypothetical protein BDB00DRAFT_815946 [Zychaea mexicana]
MFFYQLRLNLATLQYGPADLFKQLPQVLPDAKDHEASLKDQKQPARSKRSSPQRKHSSSPSSSSSSSSTITRQPNAPPTPAERTTDTATNRNNKRSQRKQQQEQHDNKSNTVTRRDFRFGAITIESIQTNKVVSTTNCGSGTLHLYRETEGIDIPTEGSIFLCILAVPTYMQALDFVKFAGSSGSNTPVESFRIIRDHTPNKYTALLKFTTPTAANEFHRRFNGKQFNVMEPELCHVVYVRNAPVNILELPTCPVCLERMDESVTDLMTIQCEHTFQCYCLSKWGDGDCPVCNYSLKPVLEEGSSKRIPKQPATPDEEAQCFTCGSTESLWICMVCGHIGCGRYHDAHAYDHYMETGDSYALEIETQRIWDYTGDRYVHRLIQNMVDGSLVELPSATSSAPVAIATTPHSSTTEASASQQTYQKNGNTAPEKLDAMTVEYTYMLTSQLESQRIHYEEQLTQIQIQISSLTAQVKNLMMNVKAAEKEREELMQVEHDTRNKIVEVNKERSKAERKLDGWKNKCRDKKREYQEEQELAASLLKNNELLKKDAARKDKAVEELNNQIAELMTLLENNNNNLE